VATPVGEASRERPSPATQGAAPAENRGAAPGPNDGAAPARPQPAQAPGTRAPAEGTVASALRAALARPGAEPAEPAATDEAQAMREAQAALARMASSRLAEGLTEARKAQSVAAVVPEHAPAEPLDRRV
jgi:hypothetical protein